MPIIDPKDKHAREKDLLERILKKIAGEFIDFSYERNNNKPFFSGENCYEEIGCKPSQKQYRLDHAYFANHLESQLEESGFSEDSYMFSIRPSHHESKKELSYDKREINDLQQDLAEEFTGQLEYYGIFNDWIKIPDNYGTPLDIKIVIDFEDPDLLKKLEKMAEDLDIPNNKNTFAFANLSSFNKKDGHNK